MTANIDAENLAGDTAIEAFEREVEVASLFGELQSSASIFHNLRISKSFAGLARV